MVSLVDSDTHRRKVDYFLRLGDSFGEKEINEGIRRQTTVISKDRIELLCLAAVVSVREMYTKLTCMLWQHQYQSG